MAVTRLNVAEQRSDISRFVVHLTRDDSSDHEDGQSAARNLRAILKTKKILAYQPHCLHGKKLDGDVPAQVRKQFDVASCSEVPLDQVDKLVQPIDGRRVQLKPYGVVFRKSFLLSRGAQPAIYINSYGKNYDIREAVDALFESAKKREFRGRGWKLLPFVNAMHELYDFTWEREWRLNRDLHFSWTDVVCLILPERGQELFKDLARSSGVAVLSPG